MATGSLEAYEATKIKDVTHVHPVGASVFILCCAVSFSVERAKAIVPFLLTLLIVPMNQVVAIFTLDFNFARILVVVFLARIALRSEWYPAPRNAVDKTLLWFVLIFCVVYVAQWHSVKSIVYRAGFALDVVGAYTIFRALIRDYNDLELAFKAMLAASLVLAAGVGMEHLVERNYFHYLGPLAENVIVREGKVRGVGPFGHYIYIGTFGAHVFPLFASFLTHRRGLALLGMAASTVIVFCSSSSGPVLGYLAGIGALMLYGMSRHLNFLRWTGIILVVALHLVMKGPVWSLLNKAAVFSGSTSYHRFYLLDQFIARFGEWALLGTRSTEHWSQYLSMWDITNEYVLVGIEGGAISLALFVALLALCYGSVGRALQANSGNQSRRFLAWCVGASLFSDTVSFMGVAYWGPILFLFLLSIAAASMLRDQAAQPADSAT